MMTALFIVAAILGISALIVVHEAGHMGVARLLGMRVERFSVGFGPVLWSARRGDTEYAVSALPLGGYVRIAGMAPGEDVDPDDRTAYCNQPAWRRVLVLAAGPGANYLTAVVLAAGLLATLGLPSPDGSSRVGEMIADRPAARAGLLPGDRITRVGDVPVSTWDELVRALQAKPGKTVALQVERGEGADQQRLTLPITPDDVGGTGPVVAFVMLVGLLRAANDLYALAQVERHWALAMVKGMITRERKAALSGPVGIVEELVKGLELGLDRFFSVIWNISVALALFNLLPLPALDGGRLVFLAYELVTRRRVNEKVESYIHAAGFIALLALLLGVTIFGDLAKYFPK